MRPTCEIVADLKDGKDVSYEELKIACLVLSSAVFFFQSDVKALLKGGISADLKKKMEYSDPETSSQEMGIPSWYWKAVKADPIEWLGPNWIPGTPEWERMHSAHQRMYEKIIQEKGE